MKQATITIEGMTCGGCVRSVERVLGQTAGVLTTRVQLGSATVDFDEAKVTEASLREAVDDAGFTVKELRIA